jgi:hypothetical protein
LKTLAAAVYACLWYFTPPDRPRFEVCGFHWLTGRPCPFCGLTRAMFAIAKGHMAQAMHFNALSPLAALMLLSLFSKGPFRDRLWTGGLAAFAIYGVYRIFSPLA